MNRRRINSVCEKLAKGNGSIGGMKMLLPDSRGHRGATCLFEVTVRGRVDRPSDGRGELRGYDRGGGAVSESRYQLFHSDALEWLRSMPTDSADLCVTSPPYTTARTYGIKSQRKAAEWVSWLRPIVVEMARVARVVALNVSDQVKGGRYQCGDLWLIADLTRIDGLCMGPMPYAWVRPGIAGSGNKHYHRRNWEPFYLLARPENLPPRWSNNTAFGKPPRWAPGGEMSHRLSNGERVNQWGRHTGGGKCRRADGSRQEGDRPSHKFGTKRQTARHPSGVMEVQSYVPPKVANPGNVIRTGNGGNQLGHPLAHENEAPMNLAVAERFVCWFCPPSGLTIDPFMGSGTTGHAAILHGRRFAGCDVRESQIELTRRRLETVTPELFA